MFVDTHCHLHDHEFFSDSQAEKILQQASAQNVKQIICIGTNPLDSLAAQTFAAQHQGVFWTYGTHPSELNKISQKSATMSPDSRLLAIGEVGLDYHYKPFDRAQQIKLFEQMLQLAQDQQLPVIFHVREAFEDFFAIIANFAPLQGVVHSFSDNKKQLRRVLDAGFYVGVNGLATYSTLPMPPLERILLETDAPFLAPTPHRSETNTPAFIPDIANFIAVKLESTLAEVAQITTSNARTLFNLPELKS